MKKLYTILSLFLLTLVIGISPVAHAESQSVEQGVTATLLEGDDTDNTDTVDVGDNSNQKGNKEENKKDEKDKVGFFKTGAKKEIIGVSLIAVLIIGGGLIFLLGSKKSKDNEEEDE